MLLLRNIGQLFLPDLDRVPGPNTCRVKTVSRAYVAVEDGTIRRLSPSNGGGGIVVYQVDPSGRFVYYYAHLEAWAEGLHEGDAVARGQVIGSVGTSGNAPPGTPHLHFAIYRLEPGSRGWHGPAVNPYDVYR